MNYLDACVLAKRLAPLEYRCVHLSHLLPWELPHLGIDGQIFEFP
jgi:phosphoribosyl 1,2-cyclic phosphate phosphodiesterase